MASVSYTHLDVYKRQPKGSTPSDPFWEKAEGLFLQAIFYYVWLEVQPADVYKRQEWSNQICKYAWCI